MNVCGVLVHVRPGSADRVEAALAAIPGVETHGRGAGGRLVATVEDTPGLSAVDALARINALPGIIAAALVYQESDPDTHVGSSLTETGSC